MVQLNMKPGILEQKEFEGYTDGVYTAQVQSFESKTSTNGNDYWRVTFKGDGFGRISTNIFDTVFGRNTLYQLVTSVGIDPERDDIDTDEIVGKYVNITIEEVEPYNDKRQWDITLIEEAGGSTDEASDDEDDDWS